MRSFSPYLPLQSHQHQAGPDETHEVQHQEALLALKSTSGEGLKAPERSSMLSFEV